MIFIIRNPLDIIISNLFIRNSSSFNSRIAEREVNELYHYYQFIEQNKFQIFSCESFDLLKGNPEDLIKRISKNFNVPVDVKLDEYKNLMNKAELSKSPKTSSLPSQLRKDFKLRYMGELNSVPRYLDLVALYNKILAKES